MLAVDTNVVIRFLVLDDVEQSLRARELVERNAVFISATVLLECEWVLRSVYRNEPAKIARDLARFGSLANVYFEDADVFGDVVRLVEAGVEFTDALHLLRGGHCDGFMTFDRGLARRAKGRTPTRVSLM